MGIETVDAEGLVKGTAVPGNDDRVVEALAKVGCEPSRDESVVLGIPLWLTNGGASVTLTNKRLVFGHHRDRFCCFEVSRADLEGCEMERDSGGLTIRTIAGKDYHIDKLEDVDIDRLAAVIGVRTLSVTPARKTATKVRQVLKSLRSLRSSEHAWRYLRLQWKLLSDDARDRREAAEAAPQLGSEAVAPLVATLKDKEADVRQAAAEALGKIGDPHAIEPLIDFMGSRAGHWSVREAATEALGKIGKSAVKGGVNLDRFGGAKIDQLAGIQGFSWDGWNGA